jgi:hypothetical protein
MIKEIKKACSGWKFFANKFKIGRKEQEVMSQAFELAEK